MTGAPPSFTFDARLARENALLFVVAAAACVLCVASGYVVFEHESLANGWWMVRRLKWFTLGSAVVGLVAGYWLSKFNQLWVSQPDDRASQAKVVLLGIVRVFVHFPFHGFMVILAVLCALTGVCFGWLFRLLRLVERDEAAPRKPAEEHLQSWMVTPLWFLMGPLFALNEDDRLPIPSSEQQHRGMVRWMPVLAFGVAFATQFVNDESGEPVDPRWLVCLGTFWLGDYLGLWWQLRARANLAAPA